MGLRYFYMDKFFVKETGLITSAAAYKLINDSHYSDVYLRQRELDKNPDAKEYAVYRTRFPYGTTIVDIDENALPHYGATYNVVKVTVSSQFFKNKQPKEVSVILQRKLIKGSRLVKPRA